MAKHKVVHGKDACTIICSGDKLKQIEPTTIIVKFPGGHIEVARTSNNTYWAHTYIDKESIVNESRIDYKWPKNNIKTIYGDKYIQKISVNIDGEYKEK